MDNPPRRWSRILVILALAMSTQANCTCAGDRAECERDGDCGNEEVCYPDDRCVSRDLAIRRGADVGNECVVLAGTEVGCDDGEICRMGYCRAPGSSVSSELCTQGTAENQAPLFGGVAEAIPDGTDAVVLRWNAAADETLPADVRYNVYVATTAGAQDFAAPSASVLGVTTTRLAGLTTGTTYYFVVRAQDEAAQIECNANERAATPKALGACVSYEDDVKPILQASCISCHSGANPPRNLHLDSFAGVHAGGLTGSEVVSCQPSASLLFMKISQDTPPVGARMPLGGPYLTATQIETVRRWIADGAVETCTGSASPCSDAVAPTFAGVTSATLTDASSARLCWAAGNDNATPAAQLVYDVFQATAPAGEVFTSPPKQSTTGGATCADVTGLTPSQQYCWVVRARDGAGNRDGNTVERCLTTPTAACIDYATVIQPIFNAECVHCHAGANPPRGLHLDSYAGVIAGGQTGNEVVSCQSAQSLLYQKVSMTNPPVGGRMPADGPPYLTQAQIGAIQQWIDEGGRASCAGADPCSDAVPPAFGGIATATALGPTKVKLCWPAATDNLTPAANLLYDAYLSSTPGGELLTGAPRQTSAAGATCMEVDALSPATQQCWIVRARDGAGNRDGNTVERCVTTPSVAPGCVDYATMIQPLLDHNCTRCHAGTRPPQWLRLDSYDAVIAGSVRRNEVAACQPQASLLVNKISATPSIGRRMPYDGPPYLTAQQQAMVSQWIASGAQRSCGEVPSCGDTTPPAFGGATSAIAVDATTARVCWAPGTDNITSAASLRYEIYEGATPGGQSFAQPAQHAAVGTTCHDVRVGPGSTTCFVVRARDLAGNRNASTVEVCASTPAASCGVDYEPLIQPILSARCTHCHQGDAGPRFLDLRTYGGALAGGSIRDAVDACDWAGSLLNTKTAGAACGNRMPFDGPPWLAASERSRLAAWISSGARRTCSAGAPCSDTTPPVFAGATTATAKSPTKIEVCWTPATDAGSPVESLVYEVYDAAASGGQNFNRAAPYAASGGATCTEITVPTAQQTCFVVRARDLAGNRDTNTVNRCATPGGACFGYDDVIQPVFNARCVHCHSGSSPPKGIRWDSYDHTISNDEVEACNGNSKLDKVVEDCEMPYDTAGGACRACLTSTQTRLLRQWVMGGAKPSCPWGGC